MERKKLTIMLAKVALLLADFRSSPGSLLMGEMISGPIVDEYGKKPVFIDQLDLLFDIDVVDKKRW